MENQTEDNRMEGVDYGQLVQVVDDADAVEMSIGTGSTQTQTVDSETQPVAEAELRTAAADALALMSSGEFIQAYQEGELYISQNQMVMATTTAQGDIEAHIPADTENLLQSDYNGDRHQMVEEQRSGMVAEELVRYIVDKVADDAESARNVSTSSVANEERDDAVVVMRNDLQKKTMIVHLLYGQRNGNTVANMLQKPPNPDKINFLKLAAAKGTAIKRANQMRKVAKTEKPIDKQVEDDENDDRTSVSSQAAPPKKKYFHDYNQYNRMKAEFIAKPDLSSKGKAELAVEIGLSKAQIDRFWINSRHGMYAFSRELLGIQGKSREARKSKKAKEVKEANAVLENLKEEDDELVSGGDNTTPAKAPRASAGVRNTPRKSYIQETLYEIDDNNDFIPTPAVSSRQKGKRAAPQEQDNEILFPNLKQTSRASLTSPATKRQKLMARKSEVIEQQADDATRLDITSSSQAVDSTKTGVVAPVRSRSVSPSNELTAEDFKIAKKVQASILMKAQSELKDLRLRLSGLEVDINDEQQQIEASTKELKELEKKLKDLNQSQDARVLERDNLRKNIEVKANREASLKAALEEF